MTPTNALKVAAAFVAGIVVALGSALVYVRVNDRPASAVYQIPPADRISDKAPAPKVEKHPAEPVAPALAGHREPNTEVYAKRPTAKLRPVVLKPVVRPKSKPVVEVAQRAPAIAEPIEVVPPKPTNVLLPAPIQTALAVNETEAVPPASPQPERHVVTLQMGTTLAVRLGETLSTEHNYSGDTFRATLDAPIVIDGFIIADRGSKVLGRVLSAEKAGRMEGRASLSLALTEINTTDGQRVSIETGLFDKQGASKAGEDTAKIAGGAALGAIIGAIGGGGKGAAIGAGVGGAAGTGAVLLSHGKPAVLNAETRLTFQLAKPATITERLN